METFVENTLATDEFESMAIVRPATSVKYRGVIILKGGSVSITKKYVTGPIDNEGVKLNCKLVDLNIESR